MPAERFFIDAILEETLSLSGPEFHHLAHVMRIAPGEEVELVNGRGSLARAKVLSLSKHEAQLQVFSVTETPLLPPHLILAIPLLRPAKLELIIEKGTELGANAFWLYPAAHSDKSDLSPHQTERLHYIAIAAMKQSGRLDLPAIQLFDKLDALFTTDALYLFGDTRPTAPKIAPQQKKVVFITGPEKGFTDKELALLDKRAAGVRLHKNILRAETAPLVAAVFLSSLSMPL